MIKRSIAAAAGGAILAVLLAVPASAQSASDMSLSERLHHYQSLLEQECVKFQKAKAALPEIENELSLVQLNHDIAEDRLDAATKASEGKSVFLGGRAVIEAYDEAKQARYRWSKHLHAAEEAYLLAELAVEEAERFKNKLHAKIDALVAQLDPPPAEEPSGGVEKADKIEKDLGELGPLVDKLTDVTEKAKKDAEAAKAEGEIVLAMTEKLPGVDPAPPPKSPPGGSTTFDTTVWPDFAIEFNAGVFAPVNDPELKGFNQNLTFDPGLDFGVAVSLEAPEPGANSWYIIGPGAYMALQTAEPDQVTNQLAPGVLDVSGDYRHYVLMATGGVGFPLGDDITGALSLGAGPARTKLKLKGPAGGTIVDDEETVFAWRARADVCLRPIEPWSIAPPGVNLGVCVYASYQETGNMDTRVVGGPAFTLEGMESLSAGITLRFSVPPPPPENRRN